MNKALLLSAITAGLVAGNLALADHHMGGKDEKKAEKCQCKGEEMEKCMKEHKNKCKGMKGEKSSCGGPGGCGQKKEEKKGG